jgi:flagellar motor switch protein FliG
MMNTKFVVKLNRLGRRAVEYVQRIDETPFRTTTNRKLALAMGKFTAEDIVKSVENARCKAELVSVQVTA